MCVGVEFTMDPAEQGAKEADGHPRGQQYK